MALEAAQIFEQVKQTVQQNWYIFAAMGALVVLSIIFNIVRLNKAKSSGGKFLKQHPDAARVYLTTKALITSEAVEVFAVNGENPVRFYEGGKSGFYLAPGSSTVDVRYTYNRPGVLYKNVTTTTDVVQRQLDVQPGENYVLGFDRDAEEFTFDTISQ